VSIDPNELGRAAWRLRSVLAERWEPRGKKKSESP